MRLQHFEFVSDLNLAGNLVLAHYRLRLDPCLVSFVGLLTFILDDRYGFEPLLVVQDDQPLLVEPSINLSFWLAVGLGAARNHFKDKLLVPRFIW